MPTTDAAVSNQITNSVQNNDVDQLPTTDTLAQQINQQITNAQLTLNNISRFEGHIKRTILNQLTQDLTKLLTNIEPNQLPTLLNVLQQISQHNSPDLNQHLNANQHQNRLIESAIPKFDGNPLNYQLFEKQFNDIIIQNETISDPIKIQFLDAATKSSTTAHNIVASAGLSDSPIRILNKLKEHFNNPTNVFFEIKNQLNQFSKVRHMFDANGWDKLYQIILNANLALKEPVLIQMVKNDCMEKIPREVIPIINSQNDDTLKSLLSIIESNRRQAMLLTNNQPKTTTDYNPANRKQINGVKIQNCVLCNKANHDIEKCAALKTIDLKTLNQKLVRSSMCLKCGKHRFIRGQKCQQTCANCSLNHATYLCKGPNPKLNAAEVEEEETGVKQLFQ